ncbi:MAG TPA: c-type cytochrome [Polyangiaceae bacterium]|nr:c-type cytochrome [Polyangiaceae bacterium]
MATRRVGSLAISFVAALSVGFAALGLVGCEDDVKPFTKSKVLGGVKISAETLEAGRESFTHYCRACHGDKGDGRGPSALGLRPPPRDFTQGKFKFAAVESGSLPNDEDFRRIVRGGLHGTAMLPWEVPEQELDNIIQYIKTFSPKWEKGKPGKPIVAPPDPWASNQSAAIARGKELYHVTTQCSGCHPSYATKGDIAAMTLRVKKFALTGFRDDMYGAVLKESEYRTTLRPLEEPPNTEHAAKTHHKHEGKEAKKEANGEEKEGAIQAARYFPMSILPPDFLRSELRSGDALTDLYRTIAAGVGGTAMPAWIATAPYTDPNTGEKWEGEKDIWALAHYVRSLVELKNTRAADELHNRLVNQPAWTPPPPPEPVAPEPASSAKPASSAAPASSAKAPKKPAPPAP